MIESPTGFEADRFLESLMVRLDRPMELQDPDDVDGNAVAPSAILRAPLQSGLRGWRHTVVRRFEEQKGTIVVLPAGVSGDILIDEPVSSILIDAAALRLSVPDIVEQFGAANEDGPISLGVAETLAHLSDGWPLFLRACCDLIAAQGLGGSELIAAVSPPAFRQRLVGRSLRGYSAADHFRLAQLAHFDQFSDSAAKAVGGVEFASKVLPLAPGLYRTTSGHLRFVDPVRLELRIDSELAPASAEVLAPVLVAEGDLLGACQLLLEAGMHDQAASMLEELPGTAIDTGDQRELLGVFRVLADRVSDHPSLALKQARVHGNLAENAASVEACELAIQASEVRDPVWLEASVELLLYRYRTIDQEEAADQLADLRSVVGVSGPLATRLREIEAQILAQSPDPHVVQVAAERFIEVASEWEYQQEHLRAAKALRGLAMGPLLHMGRYREGQERIERAAKMAISQAFDYGVTMVIKSIFDARCRDFDALARSREQGGLAVAESGLRWLESHLYFADAIVATDAGSVAGVRSGTRTAREMLGPMFPFDSGVFLAAESAVLLAEVDDHAEARRNLDVVADRIHQNPLEYHLADVVLLARAGEREQAWQAWRLLERLDIVPNDRRWRAEIELARADHIAGVDSEIDLDTVRRDLDRLELANLFEKICPELDEGLADRFDIDVLGGFRVARDGNEIEMPEGHVSVMVKLLAASGGSAHVDFVINHLWPDAERSLGLRRLKNIVRKAREHLGEDTVLRTPDRVSLAGSVNIDVVAFELMAGQAMAKRAVDPVASQAAAIGAVDIFKGPLLPHDMFDDVINERRFELELRVQELLAFVEQNFRPNAGWLADARQRIKAD